MSNRKCSARMIICFTESSGVISVSYSVLHIHTHVFNYKIYTKSVTLTVTVTVFYVHRLIMTYDGCVDT